MFVLRSCLLQKHPLVAKLFGVFLPSTADTLHVQNNDFRGRIPHQLFQLTSLVDLRLGHK